MKQQILNITYSRIHLIFFLLLFSFPCEGLNARERVDDMKEIESTIFFHASKYTFFKEKLSLRLSLQQLEKRAQLTGILLKVFSNDKSERTFIIDWEEDFPTMNIFIVHNAEIRKYSLPVDNRLFAIPTPVKIDINFKDDETVIKIGSKEVHIYNLQFSIHNSYKFEILPDLAFSKDSNMVPQLSVQKLSVFVSEGEPANTTWIWFLIIILVDFVIFLIIHLYRRRKKRREGRMADNILMQQTENVIKMAMPTKSAIFIFGKFHVYDRNGEDITKGFSPLLKELLCLLIIYSKRGGISADKLKELLWADKTNVSARNNRAVYIGKLRTILDNLGACKIHNKTGYWILETTDMFIDYFEYKDILLRESLDKNEIEKVLAITNNGNLLPAADYLWMDTFKDETSNETIQTILNFSSNLKMEREPRLILKLADIIFRFDYLNEKALYLKCKAYNILGQHASAKNSYDKFSEEYKSVYGVDFNVRFKDIEGLATNQES